MKILITCGAYQSKEYYRIKFNACFLKQDSLETPIVFPRRYRMIWDNTTPHNILYDINITPFPDDLFQLEIIIYSHDLIKTVQKHFQKWQFQKLKKL